MRNPAVAGAFYEGSEEGLRKQLRSCFTSPLGPGELPSDANRGKRRKIKGVVVPHAGYFYSGHIAAHSYLAIWKDGLPDVFVIVGPNHYSSSPWASLSTEDFLTPLGEARVEGELSKKLSGGLIEFNDAAQYSEHSIEVQVPFLQFMDAGVKFVPVCMGSQDFETASEVGRKIAAATEGLDAVVIASTDFSHYVKPEEARKKDMLAVAKILDNDPEGLYDVVVRKDISMCGYGPVMAMLTAVKFTGGEMLAYGHSGQVQNMRDVVAYCSIKIE